MEESLIGREKEFGQLREILSGAVSGKGRAVLVSGEPGIGKTSLVEMLKRLAQRDNVKLLEGVAASDSLQPFLVFSDALAGEVDRSLFSEEEHASFAQIFVVNRAGLLLAKASSESGDMDADIFAGMLSAVQDFVRDSFDSSGQQKAGLGKLEYGDMKILIEHGQHVFLTAVFRSQEHPEMREALKRTVREIEGKCGHILDNWSGKMSELAPVQGSVNALAGARFLVRKDIEGIKLENERLKLADRVLETLAGLSNRQPILLVLEDMHWADESSLFVLHYLARNIGDLKVMLLCTSRPDYQAHLAKTLEAMRADALLAEITLKNMGKEDISALINARYSPNDFPEAFKEQMFGTCAGNPFFIIELLKQMLAEGHIKLTAGTFTLEREDYTVPQTVEEVVQMRLDALAPDAVALAEYASCAGRIFETGMLASLSSIPDTNSAFEKLRAASIVERQNGNAEFCHALFQDSLYRNISARWKSVHHKAIGEYYENVYSDRKNEVLYELARHFALSGEHAKALDYCVKAGEKAESSYAMEKAAEFYEMALASLGKATGLAEKRDREIELSRRLGMLYSLTGSYQRSIEKYNFLINIIDDKNKKAEFHRHIAEVYHETGDMDKCIEESDRGLALLGGGDTEERSMLLGAKSWSYIISEKYDTALDLLAESLAIAERLGFEKQLGLACHRIGTAYWAKSQYDKALEYLQRAAGIREKMRDEYNLALTWNNLGLVYSEVGEPEKALDYYQKTRDVVKKLGDKFTVSMVLSNMGLIYQDFGELARAEDLYKESLKIKRKIGDRMGILMGLHNIGLVQLQSGMLADAVSNFKESLAISEALGAKQAIIHNHCALAEAHTELKVHSTAQEHAEKALAMSIEAEAPVEEAMCRNALGALHREEKELAKSVEEFEKAKALAEKIGNKGILAQVLYGLGLTLISKNENKKAKAMLEEAQALFQPMMMRLWQEKCEQAIKNIKNK